MRFKDIEIGKYYRLSSSPNYGYVRVIKKMAARTRENKKSFSIIECEHTVNKNDTIGFIKQFRSSCLIHCD